MCQNEQPNAYNKCQNEKSQRLEQSNIKNKRHIMLLTRGPQNLNIYLKLKRHMILQFSPSQDCRKDLKVLCMPVLHFDTQT